MNRREFLRDAALALGGMWLLGPWERSFSPPDPGAGLRLALLADAHLVNGDERRPEARRLTQAVAEISSLRPVPDLVLFAGDLAHDGNPGAVALGQEILSGLAAPLLAVRGEGDGRPESRKLWTRHFGTTPFLYEFKGVYLLGLDTVRQPTPLAAGFTLGESQRRWLGETLSRLHPGKPLLVLSHAPLTPIFRPWGWWTADAAWLPSLLSRFRPVVFLHGHVHHLGVKGGKPRGGPEVLDWGSPWPSTSETWELKTANLSLPATAWPYPSPLEGTPEGLRPGLAARGCGWLALSGPPGRWQVSPFLWEG